MLINIVRLFSVRVGMANGIMVYWGKRGREVWRKAGVLL